MKYLETEKVEILKTKVKLTISLEVNESNSQSEILNELLKIAIENGASSNILKQVFDENGNIKINSKHTFY
tara:strand:+ start:931 stop:1143 length:213 start_codon:yes stop_codon:yes gene_type:complete